MKKSTIPSAVNSPNKPRLLVLLGSPHAGGVTDRLGHAAASAVASCTVLALRDFNIQPCTGCGHCAKSGVCIYVDDAQTLFTRIRDAQALLISAPIYFYALPAQFKAFIDRSQCFWQVGGQAWPAVKTAGAILVAGRPRGEKLFAGALLTLRWFLKPFAYKLDATLLLRGLDSIADLEAQPGVAAQARAFAHALAESADADFG